MRVCWGQGPGCGNVGDQVTPYILKAAGVTHVRAKRTEVGKHLMCGSILVWAQNGDTIWGTGNSQDVLSDKMIGRNLNVLAVRGPLTRDRLLAEGEECPEVYGDPAMLLPRFYKPKVNKKHKLGAVWHYIEKKVPDKGTLITPVMPVPDFIDRICECERIVTSSLHGLIIAHAYGVPARWMKVSDRVFGNGLKFRDYLLSVGMDLYDPAWPDSDDFIPVELNIDLDKLWEVRPWA